MAIPNNKKDKIRKISRTTSDTGVKEYQERVLRPKRVQKQKPVKVARSKRRDDD